jgi:photosystem II stability/assembly factor-like uncharacterized protein
MDPTNPSTLYVTSYSRLYKSTDGGVNWQSYPFNNYCYSSGGRMIAVNPANPSIIYVGGYYAYDTANWKYAMAVFKSTNGGQTWETKRLSGNSAYASCYSLALDKANPETLYVGGYENDGSMTSGKLYKTTSGGSSWTDIIGTITGEPRTVIVAPNNSNNVFAGNYNGIFRSTNGGATWTQNSGWAAAYELAIDPANPNILYSGYAENVFISSDGGANWNYYTSGLNGTCYALVPRSSSILYGSNSGVYKSTNGGADWNESHSGILALSVPAVAFAPAARNTVFCEGAGNGFFKSSDWGSSWSRLPDFYRCDAITRIIPNPANAADLFILASG